MPLGFKSSSTLFGETLSDLLSFYQQFPGTIFLQYIDDFLLVSKTKNKNNPTKKQNPKRTIEGLLQKVQTVGCRVLAKKALICTSEMTYLGYQQWQSKEPVSE